MRMSTTRRYALLCSIVAAADIIKSFTPLEGLFDGVYAAIYIIGALVLDAIDREKER